MKCSKCGYNSFEYYDSCKKCSSDLTGYKETYSITSLILPQEAKEKLVEGCRSIDNDADQVNEIPETHDDIFSFDIPNTPSATDLRNDDPFNFDEPSAEAGKLGATKSEDDVFADLLESTSQSEESPFAATASVAAPAVAKAADSNAGPGEFDLESFSWDDTPAAPAATESAEPPDDFDSLFGDTKEDSSK